MVELNQFEIMNGIAMIIIVILYWYIASKLFLKYNSLKDKNLLYLSIIFIFQSLTWLAPTVLFLSIILTGSLISFELYLLIGHALPFAVFFWLIIITELMFKDKQKLILTIIGIYYAALVVIFFYLFFTDISLLGELRGFLGFQQGPFLIIRNLSSMIISIVSVILFYRESVKSDNAQTRLRGTLFLAAIVFVVLGAFLHIITGLAVLALLFFLLASISYYSALLTPEWLKKRLIKETE